MKATAVDPSPPPRKTARDLVVEHVRREILSNALRPGERLSVAETATSLGVSQTPAREAFQLLSAEGLLRISPYRGVYVAELSAEEYEELFVARVGYEALASRRGTEAMTEERLAVMRGHLDEMRRACAADDVDAFLDADRAFHRAHYLASGSERLWERIISLRYAAERYIRMGFERDDVGMSDVVATHSRILEAVERRDGKEAERLTAWDLRRTYEKVSQDLPLGERDES